MMSIKKTRIDWCDCTVNPVVGCPRGCPYCYARRLNARFGWIEDFGKPQFFPERLKAFECKTPKSIFVNSMSDWALWDYDEFCAVMDAIEANPQHNYIFLTKSDAAYFRLANCHSGLTVTRQGDFYNGGDMKSKMLDFVPDFLSIEPLLEPITLIGRLERLKAVIIGAETGSRKGKVIPRREWIIDIARDADRLGLAVFMKESLRGLMGADFRQDRLPWGLTE
jgi:protein gp37